MLPLECKQPKQQTEGQKGSTMDGVLAQLGGVVQINLVTKKVTEK